MSAYAPEPTELDPRPLLPSPYASHVDVDDDDDNNNIVIKIGAWDAEFFGCTESWVNCCLVWWLPCVALAQISQRVGWASYGKVLQVLVGLYMFDVIVAAILSLSVHDRYGDVIEEKFTSLYEAHPTLVVAAVGASSAVSSGVFVESFAGITMTLITLSLRGRIRKMYRIPGSGMDDAVMSICCTPCTIAQMATHVKSYNKGACDIGPVDRLPPYPGTPRRHVKPSAGIKETM